MDYQLIGKVLLNIGAIIVSYLIFTIIISILHSMIFGVETLVSKRGIYTSIVFLYLPCVMIYYGWRFTHG